jgi:DNA-binding protein HU-beta
MHKKDFYKQVAEASNHSMDDVTAVLDTALVTIEKSLRSGEKVVLTGFGTFEKRQTAARQGVNPSTGEKINISARNRVAFSAGKGLKERINS